MCFGSGTRKSNIKLENHKFAISVLEFLERSILKYNGKIESRTTVQHVTQDDLDTPETKTRIDEFNVNIAERLNDDNFKLKEGIMII